jgi:hypothetical protein
MSFDPTAEERHLVNALARVHPRMASWPIDGAEDRRAKEQAERLIEAGVIERIEHDGMALYGVRPDLMAEIGWTPDPSQN